MFNSIFYLCFLLLFTSVVIGQTTEKLSPDFGRMYPLTGEVIEEYKNLYALSEKEWYDNIKSATVKFNGSCTASFVSKTGLLVTAAHCTTSIELKNNNLRASVFNDGYLAKSHDAELKSNGLTVSQLVQSIDITEDVLSTTNGQITDAQLNTLKSIYSQKTNLKDLSLEVKRYFNDKKIILHAYKIYKDVRLVFVPKSGVRNRDLNSGDECVPYYDFDISFWRVYENGIPLNTSSNHLVMNQFNTKKEEPVFVAGFPGKTFRYKSPAELKYLAKHNLKYKNESLNNQVEVLTESIVDKEELSDSDYAGQMCRIRAINSLNSATNAAKQTQFVFEKLNEPKAINKVNDIASNLVKSNDIFRINLKLEKLYQELDEDAWALTYLSPSPRSTSWEVLFLHRLEKYRRSLISGESEDQIKALMQDAFSIGQTFGREKTKIIIKAWLLSIEEDIHSDDLFLEEVVEGKTVEEYIEYLFYNSGYGSYELSKATMENKALMISNTSPITKLASKITKRYTGAIERLKLRKPTIDSLNKELVNIMYKSIGQDMIPNADATLRLSDGMITGYNYCGFENKNTTFNSILLSEATGKIEETLLEKLPSDYRKRIAFISSTNDGTGGNSGSPLINKEGEFIGLVFKKGKHSEYANDYIYDPQNLTISIHSQAIFLCLKYIYQADSLIKEVMD